MNDERYLDDLDSLLRWTLRDLVPDQEPSLRTWRAIRAHIRAGRELRRDRPWEVPGSSSARASLIPYRLAEERDALPHLWMLVRI